MINAWQRCPVCEGSGVDPYPDKMTSNTSPPTCGVCKGARILGVGNGAPPSHLIKPAEMPSNVVRVYFFNERGKWGYTEDVPWLSFPPEGQLSIHDEFRLSLRKHLEGRHKGLVAFCMEPYHKHSHPISTKVDF